jgi:branched-subunit amino acid aminotransferase/4-amino-4-deoxychorismate lyase
MGMFVNNNGTVLSANDPTIMAGSRAFLYGDGLFESIRIMHGKPINLSAHIQRLYKGAELLKIRIPLYLTQEVFEQKILELLEKSQISTGGRCRISLDRVHGGNYKPSSNEATYFIEVQAIEENDFLLNYKGLEVDISPNVLSPFKTKNGLTKVLAAISADELGLDDFILQNDKGNLVESTSCNLFIVSNGVLYTPGLQEGCLAGTMRMQIINIAIQNGIRVYECSVLPHNLLSADEVFLTNAISGIKWIGGYRTKRYMNNTARRLVMLLNAHWSKELGI